MKVLICVILSTFFLSCGDDEPSKVDKSTNNTNLTDMGGDVEMDSGDLLCGNANVDSDEECDASIGNESCFTQGFSAGDLKCGSDCKFDTSECINKTIFNYMMVLDTTTGQGCDTSDPGSDLMYIELLDSGFSLAWAEAVNKEEGTVDGGKTNDFTDDGILDGKPPTLNGEACVDGFTDTAVVSLGCSGKIVFKFKGTAAEPIPIVGGEHTVLVGEYGTECGGSAVDSYELFGCTDDADVLKGNFDSCTFRIGGPGEGLTDFPVPE